MARGGQEGVDGAAVHDVVERALHAMDDVRKVKSQLTGAKTGIDRAYEVVEEMAARVRGRLAEVDALVLAGLVGERAGQPAGGGRRPARALRARLRAAERSPLELARSAPTCSFAGLISFGTATSLPAATSYSPGSSVRWMWSWWSAPPDPPREATEPPLSVTECGSSVWLASVMSTGPAPNFAGDTVTLSDWITPVSSMGTG